MTPICILYVSPDECEFILRLTAGQNQRDPIIRGAILQSGTINIATDSLLGDVVPGETFKKLATFLGCTSTTDLGQLSCVRTKPAQQIVDIVNDKNLTFTPVADNGTVFSDTNRRLAAGEFARVPILVGSNDQEIPGDTPQAIIGTRLVCKSYYFSLLRPLT